MSQIQIQCDNFKRDHFLEHLETVSRLHHILKHSKVILDVGSNIGLFSYAIKQLEEDCQIHLFEPVQYYLLYSKKLLGEMGNDIIFNQKGVSDVPGQLTIYKSTNENIGWNSYLLSDPFQKKGVLPIEQMVSEITEVITLDQYCQENNINKIDFVKIDVEGYEHKVLKGFMSTLRKLDQKPYLYIEVGWGTRHPNWDEANSIYQELFELGYQRVEFTNKTQDILFKPS